LVAWLLAMSNNALHNTAPVALSQPMLPETPSSRRAILRPRDQTVIAAVVLFGIVLLLVQRLSVSLSSTDKVDIRQAQRQPVQFLVNINAAGWPEIAQLPGIGETLARRVVDSREREGPFRSVSDLRRVRGFGQVTLERIEPHICIDE
jgi:competence protein ComEA